MRCDQFIGLNPRATDLLNSCNVEVTDITTRHWPDGTVEELPPQKTKISLIKREQYSKFYGMFDNEYPLSKYTFPDGRVYFEYVQAEPWSSGPMFFLALKNEDGIPFPASLWSDEEISNS